MDRDLFNFYRNMRDNLYLKKKSLKQLNVKLEDSCHIVLDSLQVKKWEISSTVYKL